MDCTVYVKNVGGKGGRPRSTLLPLYFALKGVN